MGWNYEFAMSFGEQEKAVDTFTWLTSAMSGNPILGTMFHLNVYQYELFISRGRDLKLAKVEGHDNKLSPIDPKIVKSFPEKYGNGTYCFEAWYSVPRYMVNDDGISLENTTYRAEVRTFDNGFIDYPGEPNHPTGIIYGAGDYKWFYTSALSDVAVNAAMKNLDLLTNELVVIANLGAESICDQDIGNKPTSDAWSLIYHRDVDSFVNDLKMIGEYPPQSKAPTWEIIREAIIACDTVAFKEPDKGLLIYSSFGSGGSLKHFYDVLQNSLAR